MRRNWQFFKWGFILVLLCKKMYAFRLEKIFNQLIHRVFFYQSWCVSIDNFIPIITVLSWPVSTFLQYLSCSLRFTSRERVCFRHTICQRRCIRLVYSQSSCQVPLKVTQPCFWNLEKVVPNYHVIMTERLVFIYWYPSRHVALHVTLSYLGGVNRITP